jgi:hypothetical protein
MRKLLIAACALAALPSMSLPGAALAEPAGVAGPHFAAGPVGHLAGGDLAAWRGGYWWHGWRGGQLGWWWFVNGYGYWYGAPVFPYPAYVGDLSVPGAAYPASSGRVWWFCDNPAGYYPYVRTCPAPWRPVKPTTDPVYPPP